MTIHVIHWPDILTRHAYRTWWHKMLTIHDNPCDTLNRHYDKMICLHDMKRWQYMTLNEIHWQDMITGHDDMTRNWRRKGIAFFLFKKILKRKKRRDTDKNGQKLKWKRKQTEYKQNKDKESKQNEIVRDTTVQEQDWSDNRPIPIWAMQRKAF